jgi:hypothetical protein
VWKKITLINVTIRWSLQICGFIVVWKIRCFVLKTSNFLVQTHKQNMHLFLYWNRFAERNKVWR